MKNIRKKIPNAVSTVRRDLSSWAWHLARRDGSPKNTIRKIIEEQRILGSYDHTTGNTVISFSEAPLRELISQDPVLTVENYPRLALYGIGFKKQYLFSIGARPVIYQPNKELDVLPHELRWRHVDFDLSKSLDYTWQREWRLPNERLEFGFKDAIALLEDSSDLEDLLWEINVDVDVEGSSGEWHYVGGLCKKIDFIPLEYADIEDDNSIQVCIAEDFTENLTEEEYRSLDFNGP